MDISYEEANRLFKIGHHFVVNDKVGKYSLARTGDIISLEKFYLTNGWGIHYKFVKTMNDPNRIKAYPDNNLMIHSKYIEPIATQSTSMPQVCECNIFIGPCRCGIFDAEMKEKYGEAFDRRTGLW
jgi:hypothetical protein